MPILQKPLACGTAQCPFCKKKNWKATSLVVPTFTTWSGSQVWLWESPTTRDDQRSPQDRRTRVWKGEKTLIGGKWLLYLRVFVQGKISDYVHKIQYINWSFFRSQHAWYFRGDSPSCIQLNKECLLLNATLLLRSFYFYQFSVPPVPVLGTTKASSRKAD